MMQCLRKYHKYLILMLKKIICGLISLAAAGLVSPLAHAQMRATLQTSDVAADLQAGLEAPQLLRLRPRGEPQWVNTTPERLPIAVERAGKRIPLHWMLMSGLSSVRPDRVEFVYESRRPRLRLIWEWLARA